MARPRIEFIKVRDVPNEAVEQSPLAGSHRRLLSEDPETGAFTAFCSFSPGWSGDLGEFRRPVEIFTVRGALEIDGQTLGAGSYAYVPAGSSHGQLAAHDHGEALVMVDPERAGDQDAPIDVVGEATLDWQVPGSIGDVPAGIVIKVLRVDAETSDWTWVASCIPGWQSPEVETHPTVEECLMLRGDILCGDRGSMTAGCYFWRPAMVEHGPMFSLNGGMFFFRSKGGGLSVDYTKLPGWEQMVDDYAAEEPYYGDAPF